LERGRAHGLDGGQNSAAILSGGGMPRCGIPPERSRGRLERGQTAGTQKDPAAPALRWTPEFSQRENCHHGVCAIRTVDIMSYCFKVIACKL